MTYFVLLADNAFKTATVAGAHNCKLVAQQQADNLEAKGYYMPEVWTWTKLDYYRKHKQWDITA